MERVADLTPKEREVLDLLLVGNTNKVVAKMLGISPRTVELHRLRAIQKHNVKNLVELMITYSKEYKIGAKPQMVRSTLVEAVALVRKQRSELSEMEDRLSRLLELYGDEDDPRS